MPAQRYRKKPVVIEALEWTGDNRQEALEFLGVAGQWTDTWGLTIRSDSGVHTVAHGDMIIKGTAGEFYPCKPGIFADIYEDAP